MLSKGHRDHNHHCEALMAHLEVSARQVFILMKNRSCEVMSPEEREQKASGIRGQQWHLTWRVFVCCCGLFLLLLFCLLFVFLLLFFFFNSTVKKENNKQQTNKNYDRPQVSRVPLTITDAGNPLASVMVSGTRLLKKKRKNNEKQNHKCHSCDSDGKRDSAVKQYS